jgi:hypothetical protein
MLNYTVPEALMPALLLAGVAVCGSAQANEGPTAYLPGATTGIPIGALPPPGVYVAGSVYTPYGEVVDGDGNTTPIMIANHSASINVTWASPYTILGARYGASATQIAAVHVFDAKKVGGNSSSTTGLFNTIIQPVILSWDVGSDVHVSTAHAVYLNNGQYSSRNGVRSEKAFANNYWSYQPSVAVSYLPKNWNLTANFLFTTNSINRETHYRTGDTFYADFTAARTSGKTTAGLIGSVVQQVEDDRVRGVRVGNGNRTQHFMAGPMIAHDFGKFSLSARYLANLHSRNDINLDIAFLTISGKL